MNALKKLLKDLIAADLSEINHIRMELRVNGNFTYAQAMKIFKKCIAADQLPSGVILKHGVRFKKYLQNISKRFDVIEEGELRILRK